jgi:tetratricopeptide (TPR) repeat protein
VTRLFRSGRLVAAAAVALACATACSSGKPAKSPDLASQRSDAKSSSDPDVVAEWLISELVSPGGKPDQAQAARRRLEEIKARGMLASMARGLDDSLHGRLKSVSEHYLGALEFARTSQDPRTELFAWFAAREAVAYRHSSPGLWKRQQKFVESVLDNPGNIGWLARGELVNLWVAEARSAALPKADETGATKYGCLTEVRLAGPFGRDTMRDTLRSFDAERAGPWPKAWPKDPDRGEAPQVVPTDRFGCRISPDEPIGSGIVYAESYLDVAEPTDLVLAVDGAFSVWVDDHLVFDRDLRRFGAWLSQGTRMRLERGRHRILAKLGDSSVTIRVLYPDGRPYGKKGSTDASQSYSLSAPTRVSEADPLSFVVEGGKFHDPGDDATRFFGADLANSQGSPDVANVLVEPLLAKPELATGPVLGASASFTENDPIFADTQRRDLVRELHERASEKDPKLWLPRLSIAMSQAERVGPSEAVRAVSKLVDEFPEVPAVLEQLANLYRDLGWRTEYAETVREIGRRFPEDPSALELVVPVLDEQGRSAEADKLVERIQELDPDSELALGRALSRSDYPGALAELKRLGQRRPDREDIAERVYDVMVRAGNESESWKKLEAAVQKDPENEGARLDLADAEFASGRRGALIKALVSAVEAGGSTGKLSSALDLVEGATDLEPYRLDAKKIIAEFEKSGEQLPGTAARVLDYSAVWVHADGSSRMLSHEIIRVQSAEAIRDMAEQQVGNGLTLHFRVIKQDGSVLEPEFVSGKPTVTMPHLEVGDYIETESIESMPGMSRGLRYFGPRWFFREENVAYARSEFVVVSPKSKPLQIETRNNVPPPVVTEEGNLVVRRWRVDNSPAAPVEPFGAPVVEFLPSVQIGWGASPASALRQLGDSIEDFTPLDPRITRVARRIVEPLPESAVAERAKRLYRWVTANVEEGQEDDGRRVVIGKQGNLWRGFIMLCRSLGIRVDYVAAQNRLNLPPEGPFSALSLYTNPLLRVHTEKGPVWLAMAGKFAPFGYVPAEARGMPAQVLANGEWQPIKVPNEGTSDRVAVEGKVKLAADGSAELELAQSFHGTYAMALRNVVTELNEQQLRDAVESQLLGRNLRGARLSSYRVEGIDDPEAPIVIHSKSSMRTFAQPVGGSLLIQPPFTTRVSSYAALPSRQTPLLLVQPVDQSVSLEITLPPGATLTSPIGPKRVDDGERQVVVEDQAKGDRVVIKRKVAIPSGRIQPDDYAKFVDFARRADDALLAGMRVKTK